MKIDLESPLGEVAFVVGTALDRAGIVAILTGAGAAAFHAPASGAQSLDFVIELYTPGCDAEQALFELGYERRGSVYFHDSNPLVLGFPPGPLRNGSVWETHRDGGNVLNVLSPTDSCLERLAEYAARGEESALRQAIAVARAQRACLDLERVRRWSRAADERETRYRFEQGLQDAT